MLRPAGWLYGKFTDLRNWFYDRGLIRSHSLGARTISIGNITTGGTGKTPLVAHVAEILADAGEKVCILTRGYGRENAKQRVLVSDGERVLVDARMGGDEPVELGRKLIGKAIVIADANRVAAAAWAKQKFGVTAFVLDDAFQHRRAKRDLDIVCVDATAHFKKERMLPAGRLREPTQNLARAGAVVITRSDMVEDISNLRLAIREVNPSAAVFLTRSEIVNAPSHLALPVLAFCGLGNPNSFFELLRRNKFSILGTTTFPDHHFYTQSDIDKLVSAATVSGAGALVTTAKDAVKLDAFSFEMPLHVIEIRTKTDDEEGFRRLITSS